MGEAKVKERIARLNGFTGRDHQRMVKIEKVKGEFIQKMHDNNVQLTKKQEEVIKHIESGELNSAEKISAEVILKTIQDKIAQNEKYISRSIRGDYDTNFNRAKED